MPKTHQRIHKLTVTEKLILKNAAELLIPDGNDYKVVDLSNLSNLVTMGFVNLQDTATLTTPITMTPVDTYVKFENDTAAAFTDTRYQMIPGVTGWNSVTDQFDFSSFALNTMVTMRILFTITTTGNNHEVEVRFSGAIGSSGPYTINIHRENFKASGVYRVMKVFTVFVGDANTQTYPAEIQIKSDTGSTDTVDNISFIIETTTATNSGS